jgi:hypothetical protein
MAQPVAPPAFMWQFHHAQMAIPALIGRIGNPGPGAHTADILGLPGGSFICDLALIYGIYSPCIGQQRALIRMQLLNYNHNNNLKIISLIIINSEQLKCRNWRVDSSTSCISI